MDGGNVRVFRNISPSIMEDSIFARVLEKNIDFIRNFHLLENYESLIIGIHFIRYHCTENCVSYSSPIWLHIDDEPIVFVHLIDVTSNMVGGDNIIANLNDEPSNVIRLNNFMDTLILNRNVKHAVTPMSSTQGDAHRDVILFTVEPSSTNHDQGFTGN